MKIKNYILLVIIIIVLVCSTACDFNKTEKKPEENDENIEPQINVFEMKNFISNITFDTPKESGPIINTPWENDSDFKKVQEEHGTDVLLAAFATVLKSTLPGEQHNVHLATNSVSGIIIPPGHVFSQNKSIGPYVKSKGYKEGSAYIGGVVTPSIGGGVCKIASTLYNVAILSNLEIIERHNHGMPINYLPYGQDATVAYGSKDLRFKNNTGFPILIWAIPIENTIYMAFYGKEKPPKVEWQHNILEKKETTVQYRINPDLKKGEEKIIIEGMNGARVESSINIEYPDGTSEKKNLGISFYHPMPYIIEVKNKSR